MLYEYTNNLNNNIINGIMNDYSKRFLGGYN